MTENKPTSGVAGRARSSAHLIMMVLIDYQHGAQLDGIELNTTTLADVIDVEQMFGQ